MTQQQRRGVGPDRRRSRRYLAAALAVPLGLSIPYGRAQADSLIPIEAFARTPYISQVSISPDRRFLAFITSTGDLRSVIVHDRSGQLAPHMLWTGRGPKQPDVRWCAWANATRVLCSIATTLVDRPPADSRNDGMIHVSTRLMAANFDGSQKTVLLKGNPSGNHDDILDWTAQDDETVLIQLTADGRTDVYRLNVYTSALAWETGLARYSDFFADAGGNVRLARVIHRNASITYHRRLLGESGWQPWGTFTHRERSNEFEPRAVIGGTNRFLGVRRHAGRLALWDVDFRGKRRPELIFSSPQYDVDDLAVTRNGTVLGVGYHTTHPATHYLDPKARSVIEAANRFFPDTFNSISDVTPDGSAYIVRSASDVDGGTYHLLDVSSGPAQFEQLGTQYPELPKDSMGRMQPIEYPARDGARIPAYLTRPAATAGQPGALIVMPHDGPLGRTTWEFDYLRAFLVSRGYAVLEMNYRGSSGYGWDWQQAGFEEWTGQAYSDIADGARWAIEVGIADRKRVCIAGAGFGGYQALMGAVNDGGLYRCALSIGGWTDLALAKTYMERWTARDFHKKELVFSNPARLRRRSPASHAQRINIPVLLVHAELDFNVPVSQSRLMARELERFCKPHQLLVIAETGNDLQWQSSRMALLSEIEEFLATNLAQGNMSEPVQSESCDS